MLCRYISLYIQMKFVIMFSNFDRVWLLSNFNKVRLFTTCILPGGLIILINLFHSGDYIVMCYKPKASDIIFSYFVLFLTILSTFQSTIHIQEGSGKSSSAVT